MGTLDWGRRKLVVTTARRKRSSDFIAHLEELDRLYGPKPAAPIEPVVIVLDNGPVHTSKASRAATGLSRAATGGASGCWSCGAT